MTSPLLSICCITYNHAKFIRQCLDGFVKQKTNFAIEVLIHDDASTDGTADIIRKYEQNYPEIIKPIYQTENQYSKGVPISRRYIFPKIKGKYIALCEGDDYWIDENKLQKQVDFLEENEGFSICFHPVKVYNENERKFIDNYTVPDVPETTDIKTLAKANCINTPSVVYRNNPQVFEDLNKVPGLGVGDYILHMLFARHGKIKKLSDTMAVYRLHKGGVWELKPFDYKRTIWLKVLAGLIYYFIDDQEIRDIFIEQYRKFRTPEHSDFIVKNATIFFDTGNGFNTKEMQSFSFTGSEVKISCQIPENTIATRLDLIEGSGCVISNLEILSYGGIVKYEPINGFMDKSGNLVFTNTDSQIELQGVAHWLKISCKILLLSEFPHYSVLNNYVAASHEQNRIKSELDGLVVERDRLITEKNRLVSSYPELNTQNCTLFFDTGNGFSGNEIQSFSFTGNEAEISCQIPENTVAVRLDPVEGYGCVISELEVFSYDGVVGYEPMNGFLGKTGSLIFTNTDPQIKLRGVTNWVKIRYQILFLSEFSHYRILDDYIITSQEFGGLAMERDGLVTERNRLILERDELTTARASLVAERDELATVRDSLVSERDGLATERDKLITDRNNLVAERDRVVVEYNRFEAECNTLVADLDRLITERNKLESKFPGLSAKYATIFFDTGNGFYEKESQIFSFLGDEVEITCVVPENTCALRLDPVEGYGCVISELEVFSYDGVVEYEPMNGFLSKTGSLVFTNTDPQIKLQGVTNWVKIRYQILFLSEFSHYKILDDYIITSQEFDGLAMERDSLTAERDELAAAQDRLVIERGALLASRSWRITKPLRNVASFIRRHSFLYLIFKGLNSLRRYGIKTTLKRVKNKIKKRQTIANNSYRITSLSQEELEQQSKAVFERNIKFSILTPLYNTDERFLTEMLNSVLVQTYGNWELCLADGSDDEHKYIGNICRQYAKKDKRFKYKKLKENKGITGNSIECLSLATGNYIGLLDHDDLLAPDALYENMKVICEKDAEFIYSDEDKTNEESNQFFDPYFKPAYSPDLLRAINYIMHFVVVKKEIVDNMGAFDSKFNGSQDWDFVLRASEKTKKIYHIQKILYHWRAHQISTATSITKKPYVDVAAKAAVEAHVERIGVQGIVERVCIGLYRMKWALKERPLISILIPSKNDIEYLQKCIDSVLKKSTYDNYEIIVVVNNAMNDDIVRNYDYLTSSKKTKIIYHDEKFNFSAMNNFAADYANGTHLIFLNNNTEVITESWIEEMLMHSQREDVGTVGAKLYYPDGTIQHAGVLVGVSDSKTAHAFYKVYDRYSHGYMNRLQTLQNYSAVTGACMMIKKTLFLEIGGFDENLAFSYSDIDLCLKVRSRGLFVVWTPYVELYHHEVKTKGFSDTEDEIEQRRHELSLFDSKWSKYWEEGDPYYNSNFNNDNGYFEIKG